MRTDLGWLLLATVLASALAVWWPEDAVRPVAMSEAPSVSAGVPALAAAPDLRPQAASQNEQSDLPPLTKASLSPASFDPFVGVVELARPQPVPQLPRPLLRAQSPVMSPPPPPVIEVPAMQPVAPALNYRFLGRMTGPDGVQRAYIAKADVAIPVAVGTALEEGYVVTELGPDAIRLHYPPLNADAVIAVPAAQDPSLR